MSSADVDPSNMGNNTDPMPMIPASRPILVFNHNPKAGGTSIINHLVEIKNHVVPCENPEHEFGCKPEVWEKALTRPKRSLVIVPEFSGSVPNDRAHGFVIGNMREPCSSYLSLWTYGSEGKGELRGQLSHRKDLYGLKPPFNSASDKERFKLWLQHPEVKGQIQNRVMRSYGSDGPDVLDTVDCWVFVEEFERTFLRCLQMYEDQGGFVNWNATLIAGLPERMRKKEEGDGKVARNAEGHRGNSKHDKCENMFDNEMVTWIEEQSEPLIYDRFGYERCCAPKSNFYSRVFTPTAGENISQFSLPLETEQKITSELLNEDSMSAFEDSMSALESQTIFVTEGTMVCTLLWIFFRYRRKWWNGKNP